MEPTPDSLSREELSLFYFSPKYLNTCYARKRKKKNLKQGRSGGDQLQGLPTFTGEPCLLVGVCWEMTPAPTLCRPQADVLHLPSRAARPAP